MPVFGKMQDCALCLPQAGAVAACAYGLGFVAWRTYNEGRECLEYLKLVAHLLWNARTHPAEFLLSGIKKASGHHTHFIRFRVFGLFGPHMIFPCDEGLVSHISQSDKYKRMNPLCDPGFPIVPKLIKLTPFGKYIQENFISSVWCNVDGDIHHRVKKIYNGYTAKINQDSYDRMYQKASEFVDALIKEQRSEFMLFDMLQEMMAFVQVETMLNHKLTSCSLRRYVELANACFQAAYTLKVPPEDVLQDLKNLRKDICDNAGDDGIVGFFREALADGRLKSVDEFEHNVLVAVFLSQQTLPHASFWGLVRLASDPDLCKEVRRDPEMMSLLMTEENRVHNPSSPMLMPYVAQHNDSYGPLNLPKGTIIVMLTTLLHTNPRLWKDPDEFDINRFSSAIKMKAEEKAKRRCRKSWRPSVKESDLVAALGQKSSTDGAKLSTVRLMQVGRTDANDETSRPDADESPFTHSATRLSDAPKSGVKARYIPFGVGRGNCPGQMLGAGLVLNCIKAFIDKGCLEIVDDGGLLSRPLHEHILVDTISRPRNDVRVRLVPNGQSEDGTTEDQSEDDTDEDDDNSTGDSRGATGDVSESPSTSNTK